MTSQLTTNANNNVKNVGDGIESGELKQDWPGLLDDFEVGRRNELVRDLLDRKEYRDALVSAEISKRIAAQIRMMRIDKHRNWSQEELGARAGGMAQETISVLESPHYGRYSLQTLKRLASAFDVALIVSFAPFSELVDRIIRLSPEDLAVPSPAFDPYLRASEQTTGVISRPLTTEGNVAPPLPDSDIADFMLFRAARQEALNQDLKAVSQ